jgi:Neocarzinostatin family
MQTRSNRRALYRHVVGAVLTLVANLSAVGWGERVATAASPAPSIAAQTDVAIEVTPYAGLFDGQTVRVSARGFDEGGKVWLSECATAADVNPNGCGQQLAGQPFLIVDDRGDAVGTFVVSAIAPTRPYNTADLQPCVACVLVAVEGVVAEHAPLPMASTSLTFASLPMTGFSATDTFTAGVVALIAGVLVLLGITKTRRVGRFLTFR